MFGIRRGGGQIQLNLRAGIDFTPNVETAANKTRAFIHAAQAIVSDLSAVFENLGIDALAVVSNAQAKPAVVIANFNLDSLCLRIDRKSTRLNSSHLGISYAVFCLIKKIHSNTIRSPILSCWE